MYAIRSYYAIPLPYAVTNVFFRIAGIGAAQNPYREGLAGRRIEGGVYPGAARDAKVFGFFVFVPQGTVHGDRRGVLADPGGKPEPFQRVDERQYGIDSAVGIEIDGSLALIGFRRLPALEPRAQIGTERGGLHGRMGHVGVKLGKGGSGQQNAFVGQGDVLVRFREFGGEIRRFTWVRRVHEGYVFPYPVFVAGQGYRDVSDHPRGGENVPHAFLRKTVYVSPRNRVFDPAVSGYRIGNGAKKRRY